MKNIRALTGVLQREHVGEIRFEERMANFTTMGVGGPCRALVRPPDLASIERLLESLGNLEAPYLPVGGGSNLLVSDQGFDGIIIATDALQEWEEPGDHHLRVGAGVATAKIVRWTCDKNFKGLEGLAGVPGTIGGACVMNAGGLGGNIQNSLQKVDVVTAPPTVHTVSVQAEALSLAYRSSSLPPGSIIGSIDLVFERADRSGAVRQTVREYMEHRSLTQPTGVMSVGSVFKNPEDVSAGRLIESCGLKGLSEGGALVSEKHANFIVNADRATATQIRILIERVKEAVKVQTGIVLELEVVMLGFPGDPLPAAAWTPEGVSGEGSGRTKERNPRRPSLDKVGGGVW